MLSSLVRCVRFAMILDQLCWLHQEVSVVYHHSVAGQIFRVGAAFFFPSRVRDVRNRYVSDGDNLTFWEARAKKCAG